MVIDITTDRLAVRPWEPDDAPWYVDAIDDDIRRFTREPADLDEAAWRANLAHRRADSATHTVAIVDRDGSLIGNLGIRRSSDATEFFYWVARESRGNGYASEILRGATVWAADRLGATTLELQIHPRNVASIAVAERAGYVFAGYRDSTDSCADEAGRIAIYRRAA